MAVKLQGHIPEQGQLWPGSLEHGLAEDDPPDGCQSLHALCVTARVGELEQLVSEMVEDGVCDDGREWLRSVLEVRA